MTISLPIVSSFDNKGIRKAQDALKSLGSFAADAAKIGAAAVTAVGAASLREFSQFETSFAKIQGLVGVSEAEVRKLQNAARDLAPEFGKSANEAADALFFITSAGLRGADAVGVLEASLKASAAGLGDVNAIANAATAAMNTYGPSVLSGADAVDALTEAVRLGQFAPEELASSLGRIVPISAELGVSFQETTGLIAALTRGGLSASEAVTGVRGAMQAVLKPTQEAADMLEKYGLSTDEVRTSIEEEGLLATFNKLRDAFGENEEDFTRVIGSIEGLNAVLALTGENGETATEIVTQMTDDLGVLDEAFTAVSETGAFNFNQAIAESKNVLLGIGEDLQERLLPYLEQFNTFMEENGPEIEAAFDNIFEAVQFVVDEVQEFLNNLVEDPEFQEFLTELKTTFEDMWPEIQSVIENMLDLAERVIPLLIGVIQNDLPYLESLVSIFDDLTFFLDEAIALFDDLGIEIPEFVSIVENAIAPISRLKDVIDFLADALDKARKAYEKWTGATDDVDGGAIRAEIRRAFRGNRAIGGPVSAGGAYMVGERGPELFVPSQTGEIIANGRLRASGGVVNYNLTVQAGVGDPVSIGREVVTAIKRFERANGPVFASA